MEKRLILFVVVSSLFLFLWSAIMPKSSQNAAPQLSPTQVVTNTPLPSNVENVVKLPALEETAKVQFENELMKVVFSEEHASIEKVIFKEYQDYVFTLNNGLLLDNNYKFKKNKMSKSEIEFVQIDKEKEIKKAFIFSNQRFFIELRINVQNKTTNPLVLSLPLTLGSLDFNDNKDGLGGMQFKGFSILTSEKLLHPDLKKDKSYYNIKFISLRDRYFCAIAESLNDTTGFVQFDKKHLSSITLSSGSVTINPGQQIEKVYQIYLGPQKLDLLSNIKPHWGQVIHFGTFDFFAQILLKVLDIIYGLVHSWGWAIVILSLLIYLITYPLSVKQLRSMKEMQLLQPKIEELRKIYKDNPQKLNKEVFALYKEHKVNPLGGCLPMLLQFPVFLALYQVLMRTVVLKGAKFLWINDLSAPDRLIILPNKYWVIGNEFNILPILIMIAMFFQQKMSSSASGGVSGEQQKIMLIVIPVMFGIAFYHMPAGWIVYFFINTALMLGNQILISKKP